MASGPDTLLLGTETQASDQRWVVELDKCLPTGAVPIERFDERRFLPHHDGTRHCNAPAGHSSHLRTRDRSE
jgi:hypothetical protein